MWSITSNAYEDIMSPPMTTKTARGCLRQTLMKMSPSSPKTEKIVRGDMVQVHMKYHCRMYQFSYKTYRPLPSKDVRWSWKPAEKDFHDRAHSLWSLHEKSASMLNLRVTSWRLPLPHTDTECWDDAKTLLSISPQIFQKLMLNRVILMAELSSFVARKSAVCRA
jgi:hypothetical protein